MLKHNIPTILITVVIVLLILSFCGIQPLAGYKDNIINTIKTNVAKLDGVNILPGQSKQIDGWIISLDGGIIKDNGTIIVELSITNGKQRRNFGLVNLMNPGPDIVIVDSTDNLFQANSSDPNYIIPLPPYVKEFYPKETLQVELTFNVNKYSKDMGLYLSYYSCTRNYLLFKLDDSLENK
jgi:hypothetical protein